MKIKKFIKVKIIDETDDCKNPPVIWEQVFQTTDRWSTEVQNSIHNKVLELDSEYNFVDYDNCPHFVIIVIEVTEISKKTTEKILDCDDCVSYIYNL